MISFWGISFLFLLLLLLLLRPDSGFPSFPQRTLFTAFNSLTSFKSSSRGKRLRIKRRTYRF
jgi:hypothetical protein